MEALVSTAFAVALSGQGNRGRYLQMKQTKASATKPWVHAVLHGQTTGGGVDHPNFGCGSWFQNPLKMKDLLEQQMESKLSLPVGVRKRPKLSMTLDFW